MFDLQSLSLVAGTRVEGHSLHARWVGVRFCHDDIREIGGVDPICDNPTLNHPQPILRSINLADLLPRVPLSDAGRIQSATSGVRGRRSAEI